jgi:hypothetical protein
MPVALARGAEPRESGSCTLRYSSGDSGVVLDSKPIAVE